MKKGQIQHMETIFVLLILIVIIFIGIIVVYSFYTKSLNEKRESFSRTDSITLTSSIINMPEFTCGRNTNCIDAMKILAFKSKLESKSSYYKTLLKNMDITLDIVYPESPIPVEVECVLSKFQSADSNGREFPLNCNKFTIYTSAGDKTNQEKYQTPVQVYFPSKNKKALGVLNIILYS